MQKTKKMKNAIIFGSIFGLITLTFALLYNFHVIKTLDVFLTSTYVSYFAGLACFFNGSYCNERGFLKAKIISIIAGLLFTIAAVVLLSFGLATGNIAISLWH